VLIRPVFLFYLLITISLFSLIVIVRYHTDAR